MSVGGIFQFKDGEGDKEVTISQKMGLASIATLLRVLEGSKDPLCTPNSEGDDKDLASPDHALPTLWMSERQ